MNELSFLIMLECMYRDMAELCDDTPACRAFFVNDQRRVIERLQMTAYGYSASELEAAGF
jgi:hypothetical protein